jgi:AraC-like DNA-binding protein
LARLLKRATGMTPGQLRDVERLKMVKREMRKCGAISAVADGCGFADPNYFSRWFKRQTGVSPMVWRAMEDG